MMIKSLNRQQNGEAKVTDVSTPQTLKILRNHPTKDAPVSTRDLIQKLSVPLIKRDFVPVKNSNPESTAAERNSRSGKRLVN